MKSNPHFRHSLFSVSIFVFVVLSACSKHNVKEETGVLRVPGKMGVSDYPCVDIWDYGSGTFAWAVTYTCPQNAYQDSVNTADKNRQKRLDSIIKGNPIKYPEETFAIGGTSPCQNIPPGPTAYLPLYGTSAVTNDIDVLLAAFSGLSGSAKFTVYVLQNGILGGGVFFSLEQGAVVKTFGFYPATSMYTYQTHSCGVFGRQNGTTMAAEIRNNSDLPYSVSISKVMTAIQFQNLKTYLSGPGSNFYNYNVSSFNEVHFALGALNTIGISSLYEPRTGVNNFTDLICDTPYKLGQNIKTLTVIPTNSTVNINGGITPGVPDGDIE